MSFSDDINKFIKKTKRKEALVFRKSALVVMNQIINKTPVGNPDLWDNKELWESLGWVTAGYKGGHLRANWQATLNSPANGEIDSVSSSTSVASAKRTTGQAKIGDSIYFVNNLPYAIPIENGHSTKQAPAGMVKVSIANWDGIVSTVAKQVNK